MFPPQVPDLPHGSDSGDCGECCHRPQRLTENTQHSHHVAEGAPGNCLHSPAPWEMGSVSLVPPADWGPLHVPRGPYRTTKLLNTGSSSCPWARVYPNGMLPSGGNIITPGQFGGVMSMFPGVAAPPAPLPGHAHARGGPRAAASHPATQFPGADGESR